MRVDWCVSSWFRIKNSLSLSLSEGDALINPPDLRQRSDISFFKVQGVNTRFMIGLLRRTMRQSTGRLAPDHPRAKTS